MSHLLSNDQTTQIAFSMFENKGVYALLLGSGLSRAAGIPTGWEITLDLIRRVALAKGVKDQRDWASWYRETEKAEPNYSELLAELAISPAERRSILHSYIEPDEAEREEGKKLPTAAHHAIAALIRSGYIKVVVTTNFDRLLENALREAGVEPTIVSSVDNLSGAEPITHSSCYVLKLHGDYKDARILNTEEELGGYPPAYDSLLDRIFDEHGLVVCGWSGEWDHALRAGLMRAPNRRYPVYWAARGVPGDGANEIIQHRKAIPTAIADADSFFVTLAERVTTLAETRKQNPLGIDLLVGSVKRYLAAPEDRIRLDDAISTEVDRLIERLSEEEFPTQGSLNLDVFKNSVRKYESACEATARSFGVLGRWGNGSEFSLVTDTIRALLSHADSVGNGLVVLLGLRSYPAVLLTTAYCLGLAQAERWRTLHDFLTFQVMDREDREPKQLVGTVYLGAWRGYDYNFWTSFSDVDRPHSPLSDHLFELFSSWARSFSGVTTQFERLYVRFEILAALAYLEAFDEDTLRLQIGKEQRVSMPVGRVGWRNPLRRAVVGELQAGPVKSALLEGGFARGSSGFLDLFFENLALHAGWLSWR